MIPTGSIMDNIKEKISQGKCPFCQKSRWSINNETVQLLNQEQIERSKSGLSPREFIVAECYECGFVAHFDYKKIKK